MALVLKTAPTDPPIADSDWTKTQELITMLFLGNNGPILRVVGGNIVKGSVFQIGGAVYYADSDTAITGVSSDYVKITPAGATASASYVADLSGVSWNDEYNGYVDVSGNLYVFDELKAVQHGDIAAAKNKYAQVRTDGSIGNSTTGVALGNNASATDGGAVGNNASATDGGAVGENASATDGGAVGENASATYGGAVGANASATSGGAVGRDASATSGGAVGYQASATYGGGAVGYQASATYGGAVGRGASATNGGAVGREASANGDGRSAFGAFATSTADNQIRIGTPSTTIVDGNGATITSDKRDKTDIEDNDLGLEFILKIPTKKFRKNPRELYFKREEAKPAVLDDEGNIIEPEKPGGRLITDEKHRPLYDEKAHARAEKKGSRYHRGVIAQEIESLFDPMDFSAVKRTTVKDKNAFDEYSINYTEFIAPLIKAVQELSEKVKQLESKS